MKLISTQTALVASANVAVLLRPEVIERIKSAMFRLDVTAAATAAGDLLDVFIQHRPQGSTIAWHGFVHFTQVLGDGGAKAFMARWTRALQPDVELEAPSAEGLTVATLQQGPVENDWRVRAVVVSADTPVFTFDLYCDPEF